MSMQNSASIMNETFGDPKETPENYLNNPAMIFRNGQWIPLHVYNKRVNKKWKLKKKLMKGRK